MSLEVQVRQVLKDFDKVPSDNVIEILQQIMPKFKNQIIAEYLQGKIQIILDVTDESEKKKLCKALMPYMDWYLQGR